MRRIAASECTDFVWPECHRTRSQQLITKKVGKPADTAEAAIEAVRADQSVRHREDEMVAKALADVGAVANDVDAESL